MKLSEIVIVGGKDKSGAPEMESIVLRAGEVNCLVGPTGAGKSRLLADIECLAQGDTPSGRRILPDGNTPDPQLRAQMQGRLVAQISQTMNFVLDMKVRDFLDLRSLALEHANPEQDISETIACANTLCGEPFSPETPLALLSGGQSRALMIADAACLGQSPVVLVDEIENAGIDRMAALELFTDKGKIVLLATHDPLLALSAHFRVVIRNGGMVRMVARKAEEQPIIERLRSDDRWQAELRMALRREGEVPA